MLQHRLSFPSFAKVCLGSLLHVTGVSETTLGVVARPFKPEVAVASCAGAVLSVLRCSVGADLPRIHSLMAASDGQH